MNIPISNLCRFLLIFIALFSFQAVAVERLYYVAADEIEWQYAEKHHDLMMDMTLTEDHGLFVKATKNTIGSKYKKAIYREYTDSSFSQLKQRSASEQHLGLLGPLFRAEVGDTIKVVFKNNGTRPYTIHPHGVFYSKANEGSPTNDGTSDKDKLDDKVLAGQTYTYHWEVPETAGPGPADTSSVVWLYHSHVDSIKDSNSGLVGAIVVTAKGMAKTDGSPKDVDREFINFYTVMDENESWYLADNINKYIISNKDESSSFTDRIANFFTANKDISEDEDFIEGNLMHMVNGYLFGNLPGLTMIDGEKVRWHLIALGTEVDIHTPHWHGHTGLINGHRTDVIELLPASMKTLDMTLYNPGTWMYHCHVNDHINAGMTALYTVLKK